MTSPNALDTITLSFKEESVTVRGHVANGILVRQRARLRHLIDLLGIISDVSQRYGLGSSNCWWFASVVFATLNIYNGGLTAQAPRTTFTKELVKAVSRRTDEETKAVGDRFAALYPNPLFTESPSPLPIPLPNIEDIQPRVVVTSPASYHPPESFPFPPVSPGSQPSLAPIPTRSSGSSNNQPQQSAGFPPLSTSPSSSQSSQPSHATSPGSPPSSASIKSGRRQSVIAGGLKRLTSALAFVSSWYGSMWSTTCLIIH